jgi:hypothetical protein
MLCPVLPAGSGLVKVAQQMRSSPGVEPARGVAVAAVDLNPGVAGEHGAGVVCVR